MNPTASNGNVPLGKRKKSRISTGSYLSKWLDKTMQHIQEPSMDTYDSYINPNNIWPMTPQFAPGYDPYRYNAFGCTQEPTSLPTLPTYSSPLAVPPFYTPEYRCTQSVNKSVQVQRPRRHRNSNKIEEGLSTPKQNILSGHGMLQPKNLVDSQDFASLPPIITSVGDTNSNSDMNVNDKDDASNARRFSDPCVRGLPDVAQPANGEVESGSETGSSVSESQVGNRLLTCLLDQISSLKLANERLRKDLMDTKMELDNVRQQNIMLQKGQSASMAGANLGNGMLHGQYSPGFVADVVREIRDSARLREEAMYSRVRAMVLERTDHPIELRATDPLQGIGASRQIGAQRKKTLKSGMASSDSKYSDKALEEIKSSLRSSEQDKRRMMDRICKLEDELRDLRLTTNSTLDNSKEKLTNGNVEDAESDRLRLRKELADMRKAKQNADEHALKLERLVTQMRTKFNGVQISSNGSDSLQSDPDHELSIRPRRTSTSANSTNSTVVFGPVTDL